MHLGRRGEDHGVGALDAFGQLAGVMRNAVFLGDLRGGILVAADQRRHFDFGNALKRVEMLLSERALSRYADFHYRFSEIKKIAVTSPRHCAAKQSSYSDSGLLRRFAPRNDDQ